MVFDFALILVVATFVAGVIWAVDVLFLRSRRELAVAGEGEAREPLVVEYSRSFFPILLIVLIVRSFLYEPFRIPSDSMMPTLLDGDFIFVSKFAYGLRLPVTNKKVLALGEPERGDVVVFRLPADPATNYIKRLVGLPGDHIRYEDKQLKINGEPIPIRPHGRYRGQGHDGALIGLEDLEGTEHRVLIMQHRLAHDGEYIVPDGHYFFMGDNRDNSRDSRFPEVNFVPEANLVGKAVRIWLNWNVPNAPIWSRIGDPIQ